MPLLIYALLIILILLIKSFFSYGYVLLTAASFMLLAPILLKKNRDFLKFDIIGFKKGVAWSLVILAVFIVVVYLGTTLIGRRLEFSLIPPSLIFIHLFLVAFPEELFFRGYLQTEFGNNYFSIVLASLLFAIAHFITICVFGSFNALSCSQSLLTFFPSLIMGYLYIKTSTLWSSVFFHFLANVVYISMKFPV